MNPLRLLVCIDSLAAGGAQRQTVQLLTRLDRSRFEPRVVSLHGSRMSLSRHFVPDLEAAGLPVRELDRRWHWSELPGSLRDLQRERRAFRPHLIHSISHHCNHLTRALRLLPGPPFRLLTAIRTEYNRRQLRNERLEQWLSDRVVCNSPAMEVRLREQARIPPARLRYIPNGLDVSQFATSPDPGLRERLSPGQRRVGLMMARITEQKAPHLLPEALGLLRLQGRLPSDVVFWIVGEPDSPVVMERLTASIRRHDLERQVLVLPPSSGPAAFYHAADFTVLTSLWEGTPNVVLESLAAGRPALISEAANACGLIRASTEGWVVANADGSALADALASILSLDDRALEHFGPACRARASEFGLPAMVSRYAALYEELVPGPS